MSVRSDVGIALKAAIADEVMAKHPFLDEADVYKHDEGVLFHFTSIKWYNGINKEITEFYKTLKTLSPDQFLVVEVCENSAADDFGYWDDNPWGLHCEVLARVVFEEEPDGR